MFYNVRISQLRPYLEVKLCRTSKNLMGLFSVDFTHQLIIYCRSRRLYILNFFHCQMKIFPQYTISNFQLQSPISSTFSKVSITSRTMLFSAFNFLCTVSTLSLYPLYRIFSAHFLLVLHRGLSSVFQTSSLKY